MKYYFIAQLFIKDHVCADEISVGQELYARIVDFQCPVCNARSQGRLEQFIDLDGRDWRE